MSGIYLSYRRMEAGGHAGRLVDYLSRHFGPSPVFRDIDTIRRGEDFSQAIVYDLSTLRKRALSMNHQACQTK
jgi:hypothetical protein